MLNKKILLLCGGGGSEHEISLKSAEYLKKNLQALGLDFLCAEVDKDGEWKSTEGTLLPEKDQWSYIIPCFHGYPGETGDIQDLFEKIETPYLGPNAKASKQCFDKWATKNIAEEAGVPTTPYLGFENIEQFQDRKDQVDDFFKSHQCLFVKATHQGSSVGCYKVEDLGELESFVAKAFGLSPKVLIEAAITGRELEMSAFDYEGKTHFSHPGEIILPNNKFYTFEEKYDEKSQTKVMPKAENLSDDIVTKMKNMAAKSWSALGLKDLSRIDFFLTDDNQVYLNEINTFPGMTQISLFPQMMEASGIKFSTYLAERIKTATEKN